MDSPCKRAKSNDQPTGGFNWLNTSPEGKQALDLLLRKACLPPIFVGRGQIQGPKGKGLVPLGSLAPQLSDQATKYVGQLFNGTAGALGPMASNDAFLALNFVLPDSKFAAASAAATGSAGERVDLLPNRFASHFTGEDVRTASDAHTTLARAVTEAILKTYGSIASGGDALVKPVLKELIMTNPLFESMPTKDGQPARLALQQDANGGVRYNYAKSNVHWTIKQKRSLQIAVRRKALGHCPDIKKAFVTFEKQMHALCTKPASKGVFADPCCVFWGALAAACGKSSLAAIPPQYDAPGSKVVNAVLKGGLPALQALTESNKIAAEVIERIVTWYNNHNVLLLEDANKSADKDDEVAIALLSTLEAHMNSSFALVNVYSNQVPRCTDEEIRAKIDQTDAELAIGGFKGYGARASPASDTVDYVRTHFRPGLSTVVIVCRPLCAADIKTIEALKNVERVLLQMCGPQE